MAEIMVTAEQERALSRFFRIYFYGDHLEDQGDLGAALADYLNSESRDPGGADLLAGVRQMMAAGLSEAELRALVERVWQAATIAELMGIEYAAVLDELVRRLDASKDG